MKIAVPKETYPDERRVAIVPSAIGRLIKLGFQVAVEAGAGQGADYADEEYRDAGAIIAALPSELYAGADVIFKVRAPMTEAVWGKSEIDLLPSHTLIIGFLEPLRRPELAQHLAEKNITAFALETIPRISRAQGMDALSSQASAAGYKAVLIAAEALRKYLPMLTTAAGTIRPAKVLIIGAGVAGLQAIATAKRLGAVVEAFDIRTAAKGEVESLGAKFIDVELGESGDAGGGYAKEISEQAKKREHEILSAHVSAADVVITTAAVPGKKAPLLVTEDMVQKMKSGSVIVDMAVEQGGNVAGSAADQRIVKNGVTIIGPTNLPSRMAMHTSQLLARNIVTLFEHLVVDRQIVIDLTDEITQGACITYQGKIVHPQVKELIA
ncbi:MAG: Re/Si-specific NAD(P)(+) transhydrogenase subunit alpha [Calditrichaeota bacterium]|nr:MAG: Re/Si-specific NAD(P)(+) transhydrogenase subunit alpha [Calditrichota bacterium]